MTNSPKKSRKHRDWRTPILLTLSVHMLAFTLFINHRMLLMSDGITQENFVLQGSIAKTNDVELSTEDDSGAAAGSPHSNLAKAADVAQSLPDKQPTKPLPNRNPSENEPAEPAPTDTPIGEQLSADSTNIASGTATGNTAGGGALGYRGEGQHGIGLSKNGGSKATENAVNNGLRWLAGVQDLDGKWDSDGFMVHYLRDTSGDRKYAEGSGFARNDLGLTGLCLLAFTGAGNKPDGRSYSATVRNARDWLILQQRSEDGGFGHKGRNTPETMYGHCIATLALTDLYLLTGNITLRPKIKRALLYLLSMQSDTGGWDYKQVSPATSKKFKPSGRDDMSISGWGMLAIVAAREANFEVPEDNLKRLVTLLRSHTRADGDVLYANKSPRAGHRGLAMLAVGNVCSSLFGKSSDSEMQKKQRSKIAKNPPEWDSEGVENGNLYYWYYGSMAMLLGKGQPKGQRNWRDWNIGLKRTLLDNQCKSGPRRGSFDPVHYWAKNGGGRVYSTAMGVLCLEIYYRYRPEFLHNEASELKRLWK